MEDTMPIRHCLIVAAVTTATLIPITGLQASSHREAPFITEMPKVDGTDFYLFNSYEPGRDGFVTLIANYVPLHDVYGGPNYFAMDPEALYEIHVDHNGDAREDITFQFRFTNTLKDIQVPVAGKNISIPLTNAGPITAADTSNLNVTESYSITLVRGDRRTGKKEAIANAGTGSTGFAKPADNIGNKSIPDYATYAAAHIHDINIPGCVGTGRVFVGQRKEGFVFNIGEGFDLVNTNPLGPVDAETNPLDDKNVTSLALEVPASCLTAGDSVIGAWTSSSLRQARLLRKKPSFEKPTIEGGPWKQVSRLGAALVNEVVIGLKDKDLFNGSEPKDDAQFADYVTHPSLPVLLNALFGVTAPTAIPRQDLVEVFLTGVPGLNKPSGNVQAAEILRLNTGITATPASAQNPLGVIGNDLAGFPNGRRPIDDVIDIALRAVMGVLLPLTDAPQGQLPFTDGALPTAAMYDTVFPYLKTPLPGSPSN
jgi:hypothetical protein